MELMREACFIAGEWRVGDSWNEVENPATGVIIGKVPDMGRVETEEAIAAAAAAIGPWAAMSAHSRAEILRRYYELLIRNRETLAKLLTAEQGKPLAEARGEIDYAASFIEWYAEEARRVYGETIPAHEPDKRIMVLKQPIGVVAAITPWNFPAAMITRKIGPALAVGCTVVVKPAPQTPFTALALAALGQEAGLPDGTLNVITGNAAEIGGVLTQSPTVRKISFTGSTETGVKLYGQSAPTIKKLSLELGGNAPFIVFDDADLLAAVDGAIASKFRNAGQTCVCANRFYVQAEVYERFIELFRQEVEKLNVGPGDDPQAKIGPLIDESAVRKLERHIADARTLGASVVLGGERHALGGHFFAPTVIRDATAEMLLSREEIFGPVAPVIPFATEEEVIGLANASEFGLASYFYSRDISRIWRVAEAIEAGIVGVNTGLVSTAVAPFGGVKMSGLGREGSHLGVDDYVETKYVCLAI